MPMPKFLTVALPDGYDDGSVTHVVLVGHDGSEYFVTVLKAEETAAGVATASEVVEEVGCSGGLTPLMVDAARVVRTGTAVVKGA